MANVSDWSANEKENTHIDELTLSGECGQYINKLMCAVKAKADDVDSVSSALDDRLDVVEARQEQVNVGFLLKGTVDTTDDLPDDASDGDTYIVTADSDYYAWNGTDWVDTSISDAGLVHKTGNEDVAGIKTFGNEIRTKSALKIIRSGYSIADVSSDTSNMYNVFTDSNNVTTGGVKQRTKGGVNDIYIIARKVGDTETANASLDAVYFGLNNGGSWFCPYKDNSVNLGTGTNRWKEVFAASSTISTSDARCKTQPESIPDALLDAWGDVNWRLFQMLDAVEKKGEDAARVHSGLIAQEVRDAFQARGLDAARLGFFCHDVWPAEEAETDGGGAVVEAGRPAGDRYSLRYEEALAIEAAYQRRRADRLEARIAALEARLNGNV